MGSILGPMTIHSTSEELPHKDHILLDLARPQTKKGTGSRGAYGDGHPLLVS